MNIGISIYLGTPFEQNEKIIEKARDAHVSCAFTSLQIPEETVENYETAVRQLTNKCRDAGIELMADVSPETLKKLSCTSMDQLLAWKIPYIRLDYGYSPKEIAQLSKQFMIVLNASTITEKDIFAWKKEGVECDRLIACHNYYPKPYTGLSAMRVKEINERLKCMGLQTMAFVPGNKELRGPLYEGLPTVEEHRQNRDDVLLHILQLHYDLACDRIAVGDLDVTESVWRKISCLNQGYLELQAEVNPEFRYVTDLIHHDRVDSSNDLFRSVESRSCRSRVRPQNCVQRTKGSICLSNEKYQRYEGELEISRRTLLADERVNVIGHIHPDYLKYLPYIQQGMGLRLVDRGGA